MALAKSQRSLKAWGKQKWRTKSGKKSSETGERYLPEKAIKSLSASQYAAGLVEKEKQLLRENKELSILMPNEKLFIEQLINLERNEKR